MYVHVSVYIAVFERGMMMAENFVSLEIVALAFFSMYKESHNSSFTELVCSV